MTRITDTRLATRALFGLFLSILFAGIIGTGIVLSYSPTLLQTQVNITSSAPTISGTTINTGGSINLTAGADHQVLCNFSVIDYSGQSDIDKVNATFFRANGTAANGYGAYGAQDNNSRYLNDNCSYNGTVAPFTYSYLCTFNVTYYAFNGTWNCTAWVNNTLNMPNNGTNSSWVYPLFAINVTATIAMGNLAVFDTSGAQTVNVTNFGNMALNLTVYGYGGSSNATGGGKAFDCPSGSNISVDNMRYTLTDNNVSWSSMTALTSGPKLMNGMTLARQTNDQMQFNTTYWKLYVPPNPFGLCNGTIVYDAIQGGN